MSPAQGVILYQGPSVIDGAPVIAIATGLLSPSTNIKTGPLVQIFMLRSDVHPIVAVQTGQDAAICGACQHRGKIVKDAAGVSRNTERSCYVTLIHGPTSVYKAYRKGLYGIVAPLVGRQLLRGRMVRVGAYGDPACVPSGLWDILLDRASSVTGYTHLWAEHPELSSFCMASCDTEDERVRAKALGFRTFRVRRLGEPILKGEGQCPASDELANAVQCSACMLCDGNKRHLRSDLTLKVHGSGAMHFA